ncbi:MAG: PhnD/SsuA/transferrin family substrate-binding protein [Xenococcaceae cyanobacterium MO_188.B32]|nr:PhnD/SsuA/transferrin family substrate-binding protein [Xenococcaceae cyanobacterium MO_188.B32]
MTIKPEHSSSRSEATSPLKKTNLSVIFGTLESSLGKYTRQSKAGVLLLGFSSLILPSLVSPLIPQSVERVIAPPIAIAQVQDSRSATKKTVHKIGVLAKRGPDRALAKWQPLAEYLSKNIPEHTFQIVPLNFEEIYQAVAANNIDFIIANSGMYVDFEADYGANRIATLKNLRLGNPYTLFGGVILTKADRKDIQSLKDLKGKTFMAVNKTSLGGWQMAWGVLEDEGLDPKKHLKKLSFGNTHDAVVKAVFEGEVDAGTVRTDTLERMAAEGKIQLKDFKIINQQQDVSGKFPFVHSTPLYPEWPFAVTRDVPVEISEQVARALLNMPEDSPAAKASKSEGWTIPLNYRPVHELFIDLSIGPYEELGKITLAQLVQKLWYWIVIASALLGLAALTIYFQKRSLAQQKLNEQALNEVNKSLEKSAEEQLQQKEQQRQEKEQLEEAIYTLIDEVANATEGDLTVRANLDSMELSTVADLFNAIINNLQEIAIEAKQSTNQVGYSLKQNEEAIRTLAEQAIAEARETRDTLISVEQMSRSIQAVAENASQAEQIVDDTYNTIVNSTSNMDLTVNSILNLRTTVGETAKKMKHLGESSQKISQVVSFIEEIALKTNVLAINARAEAGRAGEYGQGFTIVAEQVGALAEQCASATKEIAVIVAAIQAETQEVNQAMESGTSQVVETTRLVESTKQSLGQVLEKSQEINQLMGSISQTTVSQAKTSQNVTSLMQRIANLSETTSKSSKEVAQSMVETARVAAKLESTVAQFKVAD